MKRIAVSLIVLAATSSAYAFEIAKEFYVVGSIGRIGIDQGDIQAANDASLSGHVLSSINGYATLSNLNSTQDKSSNGFKLQLGYEFSPNFAVEGGYVDLGKTSYSATYTSTGRPWIGIGSVTSAGTITRTSKVNGWNAAGVGIYPINDSFSLFAKLGVIGAKVKYSASGSGPFATSTETDDTKWNAYYGIGATYYPNQDRDLGIRAEYERFSKVLDNNVTGSSDVSLMTVGVSSKF